MDSHALVWSHNLFVLSLSLSLSLSAYLVNNIESPVVHEKRVLTFQYTMTFRFDVDLLKLDNRLYRYCQAWQRSTLNQKYAEIYCYIAILKLFPHIPLSFHKTLVSQARSNQPQCGLLSTPRTGKEGSGDFGRFPCATSWLPRRQSDWLWSHDFELISMCETADRKTVWRSLLPMLVLKAPT